MRCYTAGSYQRMVLNEARTRTIVETAVDGIITIARHHPRLQQRAAEHFRLAPRLNA